MATQNEAYPIGHFDLCHVEFFHDGKWKFHHSAARHRAFSDAAFFKRIFGSIRVIEVRTGTALKLEG